MTTKSEKKNRVTALTRVALLELFAEELGLNYRLQQNKLYLAGYHDLWIEFESSNYHDEDEIELIADVFIKPNGTDEYIHWYDLFHLTKALLKNKRTINFSIKKHQDWDKSKLRKSTLKFYRPLFHVLTDPRTSSMLMEGELVKTGDIKLQIKSKYDSVLAKTSLGISEIIRATS